MEENDEFRVVNIPFFKKIWLSITNFERYPEMATEGVGKALSYLAKLMLIFCIIITIAMLFNFNKTLNEGIKYIDENISAINYNDGILKVEPTNQKSVNIETESGALIIDTNAKEEKIREYEKSLKNSDLGIIWLNNKVTFYASGIEETYYYENILEKLEITEFNKTDLINFISNNKTINILYFVMTIIITFLAYFIVTLIDVLILSIFGLITSYMAGIKIRYRAIFNMSVYALTISIILRLVYILISMFTDFTIKYFDFMYNAIGYICLVASIFMIKSDVIKQQMELIKIREKMRQEKEQEDAEKNKLEEKPKREDKKEDKKESENEKEPKVQDDGAENQGSHA